MIGGKRMREKRWKRKRERGGEESEESRERWRMNR